MGGISHALLAIPFHGFTKFHQEHHKHTHIPNKDPKDAWQNYPFWIAFLGFHIAPRDWYYNSISYAFAEKKTNNKRLLFVVVLLGSPCSKI